MKLNEPGAGILLQWGSGLKEELSRLGMTSALLKKDYTFFPPQLHKQLNGRKGHVRWGVAFEVNIDLGNLIGTSHVLMEMSSSSCHR